MPYRERMVLRRFRPSGLAALGAALVIAACGDSAVAGQGHTVAAPTPVPHTTGALAPQVVGPKPDPAGDWPTFDDNAQRSGVGPAYTAITATDLSRLRRQTIRLDGTVDSSVIELHAVVVDRRRRDVIVFTTSYGRTEAYDAQTGEKLWEFAPKSVGPLQGGAQITTATPIADPDRQYVYAASPDGYIHKLTLSSGHQVWETRITYDPSHEKIAGALNFDAGQLLTETDGYIGDAPPYEGHVVLIDPRNGAITHVFNSLCSNLHTLIDPPASCPASDAAIWGRPGAVVEPGSGKILVATGNAPFNGRTDWGDSVMELSPTLALLHNWTPANQSALNTDDLDLGSTEPALLPVRGKLRYAVQGGKDGILRLLNLDALDGTTGPAGPRTGGELQRIDAPGPTDVFSQPAVDGSYVFVADGAGTAAYLYGSDNRLHLAWQVGSAGTSPIVAGGLLYVYDLSNGDLDVRNPRTGHLYASLAAAPGHWNSPTVIDGRIFLPVGNDNDHLSTGTLYIWRLT